MRCQERQRSGFSCREKVVKLSSCQERKRVLEKTRFPRLRRSHGKNAMRKVQRNLAHLLCLQSRSSKASKLKSDFSKSSCRDEHDGKRFQQRSPFTQNEKKKIQDPRQTKDDGCYSLTLKENESEEPGSLEWHGNESNVKPSSGTVDDSMENSKFPLSLLSKVSFSWKSILGKSEGENRVLYGGAYCQR